MTDDFQSVGNGTGPEADRQEGPHAHQILTDVDGGHVFGVDLGADKVNALTSIWARVCSVRTLFRLRRSLQARDRGIWHSTLIDSARMFSTSWSRRSPSSTTIRCAARSSGINHLDATRQFYRVQHHRRNPHPPERTIPLQHEPRPQQRHDVRGRRTTGELDVIGWESTRGEWPRGMNIDPSGTFLYAANQNTDTIAVFRIQPSNGKLKFSTLVNTPTPVDVEFGSLA